MKPRGPLMMEHRLIEKVIALMKKTAVQIESGAKADASLIASFVDFIKTYADRLHHGKEEDLLFELLRHKEMSAYDQNMMQGLIEDHAAARRAVSEIVEANGRYLEGDLSQAGILAARLSYLADLYPVHIAKEDKDFFINSEKYLTEEEMQNLLDDFFEFDRKMIHEKYTKQYESMKLALGG